MVLHGALRQIQVLRDARDGAPSHQLLEYPRFLLVQPVRLGHLVERRDGFQRGRAACGLGRLAVVPARLAQALVGVKRAGWRGAQARHPVTADKPGGADGEQVQAAHPDDRERGVGAGQVHRAGGSQPRAHEKAEQRHHFACRIERHRSDARRLAHFGNGAGKNDAAHHVARRGQGAGYGGRDGVEQPRQHQEAERGKRQRHAIAAFQLERLAIRQGGHRHDHKHARRHGQHQVLLERRVAHALFRHARHEARNQGEQADGQHSFPDERHDVGGLVGQGVLEGAFGLQEGDARARSQKRRHGHREVPRHGQRQHERAQRGGPAWLPRMYR